MTRRLIYLVGSAGYPHYGDDRVAAAWLRHLAATEPDADVYLDCPNPGGAQLYLGDLHPRVRFVDTAFRIALAGPADDVEEIAGFGAQAARQPGFGYAHRAVGVELFQRADVFHVIGGSYVNAIWPHHLAVLAMGATLATEHGVRVAATGQSLVPTDASAELLTRLTGDYTLVDVRDPESAALVDHDRLRETGDDLLLACDDGDFDGRDSPSTMMCLQSDLVDGEVEALATTALETAKAWGLKPERVGYVEAIPGQDRVVFEMIESELPGIRFYPFAEIWREGIPARRGQRWLTTRPSMHVVAAAAGAWGVAVPVKAGYDDVAHRDLVARGSRWAIGTPGEVAPEMHGEKGFGTALEGLLEAKKGLVEEIYAR